MEAMERARVDGERAPAIGDLVGTPAPARAAGPATGDGRGEQPALAMPPLAIGAFMVTKDALVAALREYVPHLADVEAIAGDRFLLYVGAEHPDPTEAP